MAGKKDKKKAPNNVLNESVFKKFALVNNENIKYFFDNLNTLFIVVNEEKDSSKNIIYSIVNQFHPRLVYIKDHKYSSNYIYDSQFMKTSFKCFTTESQEDYNNKMSDLKFMIKNYIKLKNLYAIVL